MNVMEYKRKKSVLNAAGYRCRDNGKFDMARIWWAKEIKLMKDNPKLQELSSYVDGLNLHNRRSAL